ncbi:iron chelate uptake ABC transporter family permease subunit [Klebsiella pneumoniae]
MNTRLSPLAIILLAGLLGVAFALSIVNLNVALPYAQWRQALWQPDVDDIAQMLFHYSLLPRLAVALLVGAGLGLVGVLFQQVLRNPLAEPTTLGVATGAQLGITVTTLWAIPGVLASQFAALAGASLVGALVFGVSWGKRLSPVTLILAGLVVSLYCGALNQLMVIFHHDQLQSMFLWSTGTLTQTDWSVAQRLWPQLLGGAILTLLLLRPLTLMGLDDGVARNLGLALSLARLGALTLAIVISALLVNAVGIIGFIGLFAPLLAKMLGARRLLARLLLAALIGALLLWLSDQVILWLSRVWREVSTGSVTALIGAPLLLWLLPRLRSISAPVMNGGDNVQPERYYVQWFVLAGVALLLLAVSVALAFGRDAHGWLWAHGDLLEQLLPWRWPRVLSALFAGVMLAVAGCIIQRLTGNPMASPEVLGISSGAAFGVVLMLFFVPGDAFGWLLPAGSLGAAATLLIIMLAAGRGGFSPHRMLLAGMALMLCAVVLFKMKRQRYAWVALLPTSWLLICTLTAGWQKSFSPDTKVGFLAIANKFQAMIDSGNIPPQYTESQLAQLVFNNRLDAGLTIFFMIVVVVLALFSIKTALAALKEDKPTAKETPYEPMPENLDAIETQAKGAH